MFLQASVVLSTGGRVSASVHAGIPPGADTSQTRPPWTRHTPPQEQPPRTRHHPPPGSRHPPWEAPPRSRHLPPGSRRQHTVNERPVRILLECILVKRSFFTYVGILLQWTSEPHFDTISTSRFLFILPVWRDLPLEDHPSTDLGCGNTFLKPFVFNTESIKIKLWNHY